MRITSSIFSIFFFNDTATTEIYTLSLHDALPISSTPGAAPGSGSRSRRATTARSVPPGTGPSRTSSSRCTTTRSEEHTSELQSRQYLVCRLLLEKKKNNKSATLIDLVNTK